MPPEIRAKILRRNARYRAVFNTPDGQWVLRDLLRSAGVGKIAENNPNLTFNDGKRFLALHIATILNISDAEMLKRMQQTTSEDGEE